MLNMAYVNTAITLVIDKHWKSTTITCALFWTCKDEVDVWIAIGNETLHTIQSPAVLLLVEGSLEHYTLEVRACIRLGEVHWHHLSLTDTWDKLLTLLLVTKLIECVDTRLQRPNVLETSISSSNQLRHHREDNVWKVQSTIAARHRNAPQASLTCSLNVL